MTPELRRAIDTIEELKSERETLLHREMDYRRVLFALLDMPGMPERANAAISRLLKRTKG